MKLTAMEITRSTLLIDHPFFGAIVVRLKPAERADIPTAATDGRSLFVNREWFEGLTRDERTGVVAHEILHVAMLHHTRRNGRDMKLWNISTDHAINLELVASGFKLPSGALLDQRWKDMGAEQIYAALAQESGGAGGGEPESQDWGMIEDAPGENGQPGSPSDVAAAEAEAKVMIGQALQQAKALGRMPDRLRRMIEGILPPIVDWKSVLQQFVQATNKDAHDWRRPNRRLIGHGYYLPRVRGEYLEVMVAIDTSGSISEDDLRQFLGEVEGILASRPSKVWLVYCDAAINRVDEVTSDDIPLDVVPCGGGGTDFRPVFDFWETCEGNPSCLVYITDGFGQFPEQAPDFPVLWVKTYDSPIPWGEEVFLGNR